LLTVTVKAGRAQRRYKVVKSEGPTDLVFQSVKDGKPMRDDNILVRFVKPAARKLGIGFVNWRCLRTSYATWLIEAGANPKNVTRPFGIDSFGCVADCTSANPSAEMPICRQFWGLGKRYQVLVRLPESLERELSG
jgi:hypothetical protein